MAARCWAGGGTGFARVGNERTSAMTFGRFEIQTDACSRADFVVVGRTTRYEYRHSAVVRPFCESRFIIEPDRNTDRTVSYLDTGVVRNGIVPVRDETLNQQHAVPCRKRFAVVPRHRGARTRHSTRIRRLILNAHKVLGRRMRIQLRRGLHQSDSFVRDRRRILLVIMINFEIVTAGRKIIAR